MRRITHFACAPAGTATSIVADLQCDACPIAALARRKPAVAENMEQDFYCFVG
jgi:hypothetical protein